MSRTIVRYGLLTLLLGGALALGQQPSVDPEGRGTGGQPAPKAAKPQPRSLEELLSQAMKNNPDIRVAEAKLREAEAELNRTRLQVIQKVVTHQHDVDAIKKTVAEAENRLKAVQKLHERGAVSIEEVRAAELTAMRYKSELAKAEAELPYLLGKAPPGAEEARQLFAPLFLDVTDVRPQDHLRARQEAAEALLHFSVRRHEIRGTMADRIRVALDKSVTLDYKDKSSLQILEDLLGKAEGVPHRIIVKIDDTPNTLQFKDPLPLGAALQAFQDLAGFHQVRFVVRDYGILVTTEQNVPHGAILLHDFWKSKAPAEKSGPPAPELKK